VLLLPNAMTISPLIYDLGVIPYQDTLQRMQKFTRERTEETPDELWLLEHPPVFTQGIAGKAEHILSPHHIPVVQTDRGGQVTYHGPGQLVVYVLCHLKRQQWTVRSFVCALENTIMEYCRTLNIPTQCDSERRGVFAEGKKICSIGLRISQGASYHGIALNINMDLTPFTYINPCGYSQLPMTQIKDFQPNIKLDNVKKEIIPYFLKNLRYNPH